MNREATDDRTAHRADSELDNTFRGSLRLLGVRERVHIDISRDDGKTWTRLEADVLLNGSASARLAMVPGGPETSTARVRVSWARDPTLNVVSGAFHITVPFVQLVHPVPGVTYDYCTDMLISWRHNLGALERMDVEVNYGAGGGWIQVESTGATFSAMRGTFRHWVWGPRTSTAAVRVTWKKNAKVTATISGLSLGG